MDWLLLAQALNLLGCIVYHCTSALLSIPSILLYYLGLRKCKGFDDKPGRVAFYEGHVLHVRRSPVHNEFQYAVRMAVLDLDSPPSWFRAQASDHMTANEAREFAGTTGPVKLLTDPMTAGYVMNPISVYYCYSSAQEGGAAPRLERCIAEVTNTPWSERVTFAFQPGGDSVRKALHVSPLMDMQNTWHLEAPEPSDRLHLVVRASHPSHGDYFYAGLAARRSGSSQLNEEAGLRSLLAYGFMPHRVALLIYWQAVKLLVKGVPFYPPPDKSTYRHALLAEDRATTAAAAAPAAAAGAAATGDTTAMPPSPICPMSSAAAATAAASPQQLGKECNPDSNNNNNGVASSSGSGGCGVGSGLCPMVGLVASCGAAGAAAAAAGGCAAAAAQDGVGATASRSRSQPVGGRGRNFTWRPAPTWPWRED